MPARLGSRRMPATVVARAAGRLRAPGLSWRSPRLGFGLGWASRSPRMPCSYTARPICSISRGAPFIKRGCSMGIGGRADARLGKKSHLRPVRSQVSSVSKMHALPGAPCVTPASPPACGRDGASPRKTKRSRAAAEDGPARKRRGLAFKCRVTSSVRQPDRDLAAKPAGEPMKRERRQMTTTHDPLEPLMPFGKHRGKPVSEVLRQEPSYLGWFCNAVDGNETLKRAIRALPGFDEACGNRFGQKPSVRKPDEDSRSPEHGRGSPALPGGSRQALPGDTPSAGRGVNSQGHELAQHLPPSCASSRRFVSVRADDRLHQLLHAPPIRRFPGREADPGERDAPFPTLMRILFPPSIAPPPPLSDQGKEATDQNLSDGDHFAARSPMT